MFKSLSRAAFQPRSILTQTSVSMGQNLSLVQAVGSAMFSSNTPSPPSAVSSSPKSPKREKKMQKLAFFGLGNVGGPFAGTRHNIGREIIDQIAKSYSVSLDKNRFTCRFTELTIAGRPVVLATPDTLMNRSGRAVRALTDELRVYHENVIVIYDDVDLPLGAIRLRNRGSSGGQKGVEDTIRHMGKDSRFVRVRVGIGRGNGGAFVLDTSTHVLKRFSESERPLAELTMKRVAQCVDTIIHEGLAVAQNKYNRTAEEFEQWEKAEAEKKRDREQRRQEGKGEETKREPSKDKAESVASSAAEAAPESRRARRKAKARKRESASDAPATAAPAQSDKTTSSVSAASSGDADSAQTSPKRAKQQTQTVTVHDAIERKAAAAVTQ